MPAVEDSPSALLSLLSPSPPPSSSSSVLPPPDDGEDNGVRVRDGERRRPYSSSSLARKIWAAYFALSATSLALGSYRNVRDASDLISASAERNSNGREEGGDGATAATFRKYVSADPSRFGAGAGAGGASMCGKSYVDVLSDSLYRPGATICCPDPESLIRHPSWNGYRRGLCGDRRGRAQSGGIGGRLTRFPDAWLLPLVPLLLRLAWEAFVSAGIWGRMRGRGGGGDGKPVVTAALTDGLRRLCYYVALMSVRGWVLYVFLNWSGGYALDAIGWPSSPGGVDGGDCWYKDLLKPRLRDGDEACYGRRFDFSDHVVLFYGQYLPVAISELTHYLVRGEGSGSSPGANDPILIRAVVVGYVLYLSYICASAAMRTAMYFHTPLEILVGYGISLIASVPAAILSGGGRMTMMTTTSKRWDRATRFVGMAAVSIPPPSLVEEKSR